MNLNNRINNYYWWFWAIAILYTTTAIFGWEPGYIFTIEVLTLGFISSLFIKPAKSDVNILVNAVFLIIALFGLWDAGKLYAFILLLCLLFLKAFTSRCPITWFFTFFLRNNQRMNTSC